MQLVGGLWSLAAAFALGAVLGAGLVVLLRGPALPNADVSISDASSAEPDDESSFIDPSTGLASRRYVEMFLHREMSRSERLGKPLSVAVFDLDGSRALTDSLGEDAIDRALSEMGTALKAGLREYDVIGRYSQGRLIVVLPESSTDQAFEAAERLHALLATLRLNNEPVLVSVGVATFPEHATNADDLINSAHHALNTGRASGSGRRVHCCERLMRAS